MEAMFNLVENLENEEISFVPNASILTETLCGSSVLMTMCQLGC